MANQKVRNRSVDSDIFKNYLKNRGLSVKDVCSKTSLSEKTLKRCLEDGFMSIGIVLDICYALDDGADNLFGEDTSPSWQKSLGYLSGCEERIG